MPLPSVSNKLKASLISSISVVVSPFIIDIIICSDEMNVEARL